MPLQYTTEPVAVYFVAANMNHVSILPIPNITFLRYDYFSRVDTEEPSTNEIRSEIFSN